MGIVLTFVYKSRLPYVMSRVSWGSPFCFNLDSAIMTVHDVMYSVGWTTNVVQEDHTWDIVYSASKFM